MSLAIRAVFTIGLMVLFYALAIAVATALVLVGLLLLQSFPAHRRLELIFASQVFFFVAGVIAWSVLPRFDHFKAPGPEIVAPEHPRLFAEILAVAAATGQRMPDHVYLISEVNAFVAQRGGIMGIGSKRVMGVGLPLLRTLQVDELRAVLAHEMGHFHGGDTRLGPWIYKTRSGLARTVANLTKTRQLADHWIKLQRPHIGIGRQWNYRWIGQVFVGAQTPFRWFLLGFMRVSQAISRAQEYSADAVAVRAEGCRAFVDGLKKTHAASIAHAIYLRTQVLPLVKQGALPAVGEGFSRFLLNNGFTKLLDEAVVAEMEGGTASPYDSHPPLRMRIATATALRGPDKPPDPCPAIELIEDASRIESDELANHADRKLEPVSWNDTEKLWIASWREEVAQAKQLLMEIRIDAIPSDLRYMYRLTARLIGQREADAASHEGIGRWWTSTISAALAVMLLDAGFAVTTRLGEPFRFTRGDATVEPFVEFQQLITGEISEDAWRTRWTKLGFANRTLAVNAPGK